MNTSASFLHLVSPHMELSESKSTSGDSLILTTSINICDGNITMCTPHDGITSTVLKEVACRRKEVRKTRRFGGRRSETPFARRRLVFEAEREE